MATDLTVIQPVRQHFGNNSNLFQDEEPSAPFVGASRDYSFDCPGVDPSVPAVLMFQSFEVNFRSNIMTINGNTIFGGIPVSTGREWNGNVMLITPNRLQETGNTLHIEARNLNGGTGGNLDDFILDNIVVLYKTT